MLFNELIEQQGIESVSSKTNISTINLNYLVNEDFENLNRVKALGFLLILEREYPDIDINDLRQNIKLYYEEHKPVDDNVVMIPKDSTTGGGFSFFKFFIIVTILVGGYYLYSQRKLDPIIQQIQDKPNSFDDKKALETNATTEDAKKVTIEEAEEVRIETPITPKIEAIALEDSKKVAPVQSALSNKPTSEETQSIESVVKEVSKEFLKNEANNTIKEVVEENKPETTTTPITTITINPTRGMLWYGFINIETKKRREFMKRVSAPFEINNGKWLLVTGHGFLNIVSETKTLEIADNKKHYFLIDSSDIKEITKKEFRELNGHRGW